MSDPRRFVIVGAGLAGAKAAEALRSLGFDGSVTLLGAEAHRPYERPPLSKGYLIGTADRSSVFVHPEDFYPSQDIDLRLATTVSGIDRAARQVELSDGGSVGYDKLLLATGSRPRVLPVAGADADGVHYLRSLDDCDRLRLSLAPGLKLVVIGAGWIGLEVAAAARQAGADVTVVETAELPLLRVLGPEIAQAFAALHSEHGVDLRMKTLTSRIVTSDGHATGVELHDGSVLAADTVLIGVGAEPRLELAEQARLTINNGIVTDETLTTTDPDILAAGDVANAYHPALGTHIRVEHWANALKQPAAAAATMLGSPTAYKDLPYFYTDQYDLGMEYVGYVEPGGYDEVIVRGDLERREFVAFWLSHGRVLAGMNVNVWDVVEDVKALIMRNSNVDAAGLADMNIPLAELS